MITNFKLFERKEQISVSEIIDEINYKNINDLIYINNTFEIIGDWDDVNYEVVFYNLLFSLIAFKFHINDIKFLLSKNIDVNKKITKYYTHQYMDKKYDIKRVNLKGANALLLGCIVNSKVRVLKALIDAGIDWKNTVEGKDMFYYLDPVRAEIILNSYPEIKEWYLKNQRIKQFNI